MKTYKITVCEKGFFGSNHTINVTDENENGNFTTYEDGCFKLYGAKDGKSINFSFPLDKIKYITVEET